MNTTALDLELIRRAPKVLLHEHLDGGLRPETVQELARETGYGELPEGCETDSEALSDWFFRGASRGSLPQYLEGFRHTIALMQSAAALERIAYELMEDMAADGVVYAEVRFAPHFHTHAELGLEGVMTAVLQGLRRGAEEWGVGYGLIVCAMRNESPELSEKLVELAVSFRNRGCVGFDLAGEEAGHPAKDHVRAFQFAQRANFSITIHAGESFGPDSIWQALQFCGAHRIGHGTRLIEDIVIYDNKVIQVGGLAQYVLDHRIPLELCLSSNVHTGATPSLEEHPFPYFLSSGYRVTLNTDNRLMSRTTMSDEYAIANKHFGCSLNELELLSLNAMKSAFASYGERCRFIYNRIKPGFATLREELGLEPGGGEYIRPH
ncbi:MAG: adenosine deaminase [Planctomycetota bacterium]|jgi:adenosine deaminase|nr:adenosine deaminase [Planctomycetota bacterium]MDP6518870.1 adenosine deaminase [Planctomycetota bacterium]MDP6837968.1 adenosine deaminase [Planctomycetota bacterium]MDP6956923.1 adenosine deaminase [Planctomycetota bacterium]